VDALIAPDGRAAGIAAVAAELRRFYGLDLSIPGAARQLSLAAGAARPRLLSIYGKPVATVILERLPATLLLMIAALSFAFFFGLVLGVLAARRVNGWPDTLISTLGLVFYATPSFWFGLMAIVVFSVYLEWLPAGGFEAIGAGYSGLGRVLDIATHLLLPTLTLGLIFLAIYLRIMRASMLEVLSLDFVRTARAKGLDETRVVIRHVLRNALLPMVTLVGLQAGTMLGGSVVVESVFSLPRPRTPRLRVGGAAGPQHAARHRLRLRAGGHHGELPGGSPLRAARPADRVGQVRRFLAAYLRSPSGHHRPRAAARRRRHGALGRPALPARPALARRPPAAMARGE
jgi:peptide/nickel transport system permease protein